MSDQPERPIERLLREYGRQRRPSEPFKLHAATRRLLQGEVSRVYRDKRLKPRWLCLSTFPKLAWGLCGVAILGLISIQLMLTVRQNKSENLLAQKEERAAPALPGAAPIATLNKELLRQNEPAVNLADADRRTQVAVKASQKPESQSTPPTDSLAVPSLMLAEKEAAKDAVSERELNTVTLAKAPEPASASGATRSFQYGLTSAAMPTFRDSYRSTSVQNFVQTAAKTKATLNPPTVSVLASFQLEQSGSDVRIIDQDGSVYTGSIGAPQTAAPMQLSQPPVSKRIETTRVFAVRPVPSPPAQEFFFQVSGTNITLQQPIVFNGRWWSQTNARPAVSATNAATDGTLVGRQTRTAPRSLSGSQISGSAVIGGGTGIPVTAVSTKP